MHKSKTFWLSLAPAIILLIILYASIITDSGKQHQKEMEKATETVSESDSESISSIKIIKLSDFKAQTGYVYYNVPLSDDLQEYTQDICTAYGIDFPLVLAIVSAESDYRFNLISPTHDYGIMQINRSNHSDLRERLGISDFLDPYENIYAGVYMLAEILSDYQTLDEVLMVYNCGERGAKRLWKRGIRSTKYIRSIYRTISNLELR